MPSEMSRIPPYFRCSSITSVRQKFGPAQKTPPPLPVRKDFAKRAEADGIERFPPEAHSFSSSLCLQANSFSLSPPQKWNARGLEIDLWMFSGCWSLVLGAFYIAPHKNMRKYADIRVFIRTVISNTFHLNRFEFSNSAACHTPDKRERF